MSDKFYWLKERHNPQFKEPYYVACGQITIAEAKKIESTNYGMNFMQKFSTKEEYENEIETLKKKGLRVQIMV